MLSRIFPLDKWATRLALLMLLLLSWQVWVMPDAQMRYWLLLAADLPDALENKITAKYLTRLHLWVIRLVFTLFCWLMPWLFYQAYMGLNSFWKSLLYYSSRRRTKVLRFFYLTPKDGWALGAVMGYWSYLAFSHPILIDEAFSYVFLIDRGTLVTASFYPGPNNHIAFLLLCQLADNLGLEPDIVLRFTALAVAFFTLISLYLVLRYWLGFRAAIFAIVIWGFSLWGGYFASHARGYMLQQTAIIFCMSALVISEIKWSKHIFIISSIIGFYTIPTFLLPFIPIFLFYFYTQISKKRSAPSVGLDLLKIIGITLVLYLPVLILSGPELLFANEWVAAEKSPDFWRDILATLWLSYNDAHYFEVWAAVMMLLAFLGLMLSCLAFSRQLAPIWQLSPAQLRHIGFFLLAVSLLPWLPVLMLQVLPPVRVFGWRNMLELLFLGAFLGKLWEHYKWTIWRVPVLICTLIIPASAIYHDKYSNPTPEIYEELPYVIRPILAHNPSSVFVNEDIHNVFLRYEAIKMGKSLQVETIADPAYSKYDIIILKKGEKFPLFFEKEKWTVLAENNFVTAFKINGILRDVIKDDRTRLFEAREKR